MKEFEQLELFDKRRNSSPYKLTTYFYKVLSTVRERNIFSRNIGADLSLAKKFLESIQDELNISSSGAFEIGQGMIFDLINHENEIGLRFPITSLSVLGQAKMKFVTEELFKRKRLREIEDTPANFDEIYEHYYVNKYNENETKCLDLDRMLEEKDD